MTESETKSSLSAVRWLSWLLLLVTLYGLSTGPFVWLTVRGIIPIGVAARIDIIYNPLEVLRMSDVGRQLLDWYINLFVP